MSASRRVAAVLFLAILVSATAAPVSDFTGSPAREHSLKRPAGKKGLACIVDLADCRALGVQHANDNIDIGGLLDWSTPDPPASFIFEGRKVGLHAPAVRGLDARIKGRSDQEIGVVGILLNYVKKPKPGETARPSPLVHPRTNPVTVPNGPAAFNTATPEGLFLYRAIVHWIVERYTHPDEAHGRLTGLVVGNEVQSHWSWYHLGEMDEAEVVREYGTSLRAASLIAQAIHRDFRIYLSMDHHWTLRGEQGNPRRAMRGIDFLHTIAEQARREGDYPWHVAFHPYPEKLFEPRFWQDKTAPLRFDAPRITFKNLEVLTAFLGQPTYHFAGQPRHIALTEQGFHCPKTPDGEQAQAAAFALAFKRVNAMPGIESFIYHRHVDHPREGGLHLGLREYTAGPGLARKRLIWETFERAGTPEEDAAFRFALPLIGRTDWSALVADRETIVR